MNPCSFDPRNLDHPAQLRSERETAAVASTLDDIARDRCRRIISAHIGEGGYQEFLRQRQPALGERTGAEILAADPHGLLARLELLERGPQ